LHGNFKDSERLKYHLAQISCFPLILSEEEMALEILLR